MKKILFRCDSSSTIGLGHVKRCLVLAKRLKECNKNLKIFFSTLDLDGNINFEILKEGFTIYSLKDNSVSSLDYVIKELSIDFLIIDLYEIDITFETQLKLNNHSLKIMSFDDTLNLHNVDFILNHGIQAKKHSYKNLVPKNCKILCGSEYTLLRDEFFKNYNKKIEKNSIAIILGGNDVLNLSSKVALFLFEINNEYKISVITTRVNPHLKELEKKIEYINKKDFYGKLDLKFSRDKLVKKILKEIK